jgi:hypothetical protein
MATHTKGPWDAVPKDDPRGQPGAYFRGIVEIVSMDPPFSIVLASRAREWEANARLIAAAPDMLAALQACTDVLNHFPVGSRLRAKVESAIAKAEGK